MNRKRRGCAIILIGLLLVIGALGLSYHNMQEALTADREARAAVAELEQMQANGTGPEGQTGPEAGTVDPESGLSVRTVAGLGYCGVLSLPALGLELPVAEGWSYPNLRKSPCLFTGSPGGKNMVICAHNYARHFGSIGNMPAGSPVTFTDMDGREYDYTVASVEVLDPYAFEAMVYSDYDLTLFTCTLGGRTRVTVRCQEVLPKEDTSPLAGIYE